MDIKHYIIGTTGITGNTAGYIIQRQGMTGSPSNIVIRAGGVAADADGAD